MKPRLFIPLQVMFILCSFLSGLDYAFGIGHWKSYVQLFGWMELLLTAVAAVLLVLQLVEKGQAGAASGLLGVTFLLWLMQFCPAVYGMMLGGHYAQYSLFHWVCILLGGGLLFQLRAKTPNGIQSD